MSPSRLNPVEPPWYGPVCPVVWEGRRREAPPYPDRWRYCGRTLLIMQVGEFFNSIGY